MKSSSLDGINYKMLHFRILIGRKMQYQKMSRVKVLFKITRWRQRIFSFHYSSFVNNVSCLKVIKTIDFWYWKILKQLCLERCNILLKNMGSIVIINCLCLRLPIRVIWWVLKLSKSPCQNAVSIIVLLNWSSMLKVRYYLVFWENNDI